jgi:hypothetical protein
LTAAFLTEDEIEELWNSELPGSTVFRAVEPIISVGDILEPQLVDISDKLALLPGDVELSTYEDTLSSQWSDSMNDNNLYRPMRILSSFWHIMQSAGGKANADIILVDIGPNLGAINRSALIAADFVAVPLGADLFSLQGLRNLGPALKAWKINWKKRLENWNSSRDSQKSPMELPTGEMESIGYLCQQYGARLDRPVKAYDKWVRRIPSAYRKYVLESSEKFDGIPEGDPFCLGTIKHYRSLIPMGQESRKPIFNLTAADGAIGSHAAAVGSAKADFGALTRLIGTKTGIF